MMKTKIYATIYVLALSAVLIFAGCKKSAGGNNNVVGNWQFTGFTSKYTGYNTATVDTVTNFSTYNAQTQAMVTYITRSAAMPYRDTSYYSLNYSNWNIMSNGTYTITENADTIARTNTGTWEYLSNSTANNAIMFGIGGSEIFQYIQQNGQPVVLNIQTVTSHQLVLTFGSSFTDSSGNFGNTTGSVTFSK